MDKYIYDPDDNFNFQKISLKTPTLISGGGFFSKFAIDNEPFYIKTPKCRTKQGFVKSGGKKIYCDLMFSTECNEDFFRWMEGFVIHIQTKIYERRDDWFKGDLTDNDIEDATISPIKLYKGGKFNLVRTTVNSKAINDSPSIKVYDSNLKEIDLEDIDETMEVITLLEFKGIKCTLKSFQFEIEIKQMMVIKLVHVLDSCVLGGAAEPSNTAASVLPTTEEESIQEISLPDVEEEPINAQSCDPIEITPDVESITEIQDQTATLNEEEHLDNLEETSREESEDTASEDTMSTVDTDDVIAAAEASDIEDYLVNKKDVVKNVYDGLEEVSDLDNFEEEEVKENTNIKLKQPNELYYKMYKEAKERAKNAQEKAIAMYLEAKNIKNLYNIDDADDDSAAAGVEEDDFSIDDL